jgi:hypothetical protein
VLTPMTRTEAFARTVQGGAFSSNPQTVSTLHHSPLQEILRHNRRAGLPQSLAATVLDAGTQLFPKHAKCLNIATIRMRSSLTHVPTSCRGRDTSVGIATRYGLVGPGIESRWRRDFPHPSRPALGPTQPPIQWIPGLSRG